MGGDLTGAGGGNTSGVSSDGSSDVSSDGTSGRTSGAVPDVPIVTIVPYAADHAVACAAVLASVPEWFGRPEANAAYLAKLAQSPSWVALQGQAVVGALTLTEPCRHAFEIHFLVVARAWHGRGIGTALVGLAQEQARQRGGRWLQVKTLGPTHPDPQYARTRRFYLGCGFEPMFESLSLWPGTPALVLVKQVPPATT